MSSSLSGLATAFVATLSALVLSLLVSSAQASFDTFDDELTRNAASVIMLDRTLDEYGPQTDDIRTSIKAAYARRIELLFSAAVAASEKVDGSRAIALEENIDTRLRALSPVGTVQQGLQARALEINSEINKTRALIHVQREDSIPTALLVVLGGWSALIFTTFGLFAPRNAVVVGALLACALSASGAVFLILEMNSPFNGLITLSSAPMHEALLHLGR